MKENKNLAQEALIQMKQVEEAIAENAKGILASTMKEEINQLVKESLSEQDEVDLDVDMETDDVDMDTDNEDEVEMDVELPDMDSDEAPIDLTDASDEEILKVFKAMGENDGIIVTKDGEDIHLKDNDSDTEYLLKLREQDEDDEEELDEEEEMDEQEEMDESNDMDVDALIAQLFQPDSTGEVDVDVDMEDESPEMEMDDEESSDMEDEEEAEEVVYEIMFDEEDDEDEEEMDEQEEMDEEEDQMDEQEEMDEEEDDDEELDEQNWEESMDESYNPKKAKKGVGVGIGNGPKFSYKKTTGGFNEKKKEGPKSVGTGKAKFEYKKGANMEGKAKKVETKEGMHMKKKETKEAARALGMGSAFRKGGLPKPRAHSKANTAIKKESIESEVKMLREKNEEYRKALNIFREKLNEVAIFNSNLAYATRLFTEHSTTKKEKINILRRFDGVETLKESKNLYKSIKDELTQVDTKPITEAVETKLNKNVSSGSSVSLIESKTYENPQFLRMRDLMSKIN